jgi:hypothetical protein
MATLPHVLNVELEVSERNPPAGWVRADGGTRRPFGGWLELLAMLQNALEAEAADDAGQARAPIRQVQAGSRRGEAST